MMIGAGARKSILIQRYNTIPYERGIYVKWTPELECAVLGEYLYDQSTMREVAEKFGLREKQVERRIERMRERQKQIKNR